MVKVVTFKIEEELLEQVDLFAINHKLYRSEVIRLAIQKFLREVDKGEKVQVNEVVIRYYDEVAEPKKAKGIEG
jgi:metal-responsive CopG/Arc/MetJ family transcriptional regulator